MSAGTYEVHGLRVASELPLDAPRTTGGPDLSFRTLPDDAARPAAPIGARLLCEVAAPGVGFRAVETTESILLSFDRGYSFEISADGRRITAHAGKADPTLVPTFLTGTVLAFTLALRGVVVLHASAVVTETGTLAFAGASASGKTTMAAALCSEGARLVSDDALRVERDGDVVACHSGTTTLRLRRPLAVLAGAFPPESRTTTPDDRIGIAPDFAPGKRPLAAIVVLEPAAELQVERLPPRDALVALLSHPRWFGWKATAPLRASFEQLADIVGAVEVYRARAPVDRGSTSELARPIVHSIPSR